MAGEIMEFEDIKVSMERIAVNIAEIEGIASGIRGVCAWLLEDADEGHLIDCGLKRIERLCAEMFGEGKDD